MGICSKCFNYVFCLERAQAESGLPWDEFQKQYKEKEECDSFIDPDVTVGFPCRVGDSVSCDICDKDGNYRSMSYYVSSFYTDEPNVWFAHLIEETDSDVKDEKDVPIELISYIFQSDVVEDPAPVFFAHIGERSKYYTPPKAREPFDTSNYLL